MSALAYIALGSNLGDRHEHLRAAVAELRQEPGLRVLRQSPVYESAPLGGPAGKEPYVNAVADVGGAHGDSVRHAPLLAEGCVRLGYNVTAGDQCQLRDGLGRGGDGVRQRDGWVVLDVGVDRATHTAKTDNTEAVSLHAYSSKRSAQMRSPTDITGRGQSGHGKNGRKDSDGMALAGALAVVSP